MMNASFCQIGCVGQLVRSDQGRAVSSRELVTVSGTGLISEPVAGWPAPDVAARVARACQRHPTWSGELSG